MHGMKILLVLAAALGGARAYIDAEQRELRAGAPGGFRTLFFVRKLTPMFNTAIERPLPFGAHKRIEAEENLSPFHSVLVIRRRPEDALNTLFSKSYNTESFIKDFLAAHLQHAPAVKDARSPKQFNTEKIYDELYKKSKHPPKLKSSEKDKELFVEDDIDSIIANVAKELAPPETSEEAEHRSSFGKKVRRTKHHLRHKLKKARNTLGRSFKINGMTIIIFLVIAGLSGFAGYCMRGRPASDNYIPLAK